MANYVLCSLSIQALEGQNLKYFAGEHVVYMTVLSLYMMLPGPAVRLGQLQLFASKENAAS